MADTKDKQELAVERTDWAEDRTVLANERTFAGWLRTGMASIAIALGLRALFGPFEPEWIPKTVASAFVLIAVGIFWAARQNAIRASARLDAHDATRQGTRRITAIAVSLSAGAIATGVILWFL